MRGALDNRDDAEEAPPATEPSAAVDGDEAAAEPAAADYQLQRALDLIHGLSLYSTRVATGGE